MMRELIGAAIAIGVIAIVALFLGCFAPIAEESAQMTEDDSDPFNGEDPHSEEYTK